MNVSTRWNIAFDIRIPGWLEIPLLPPDDHASFIDGAIADLADLLGDAWEPAREPMARDVLRAGLEDRDPSAAYAFQVWSRQLEAVASVNIRLGEAAGMPDFAAQGFRVLPSDLATNIGPGIEATLAREMQFEGEDADPVTVVYANYIYSDAVHALVVEVEPTPRDLFQVVMMGLSGLLDTLTVVAPDGQPFTTAPAASDHALDTIWQVPADEDPRGGVRG